jgi:hypothetical protein
MMNERIDPGSTNTEMPGTQRQSREFSRDRGQGIWPVTQVW